MPRDAATSSWFWAGEAKSSTTMGKLRLVNESGDEIVLEPGDSVELIGDKSTVKGLSARLEVFEVEDTREK